MLLTATPEDAMNRIRERARNGEERLNIGYNNRIAQNTEEAVRKFATKGGRAAQIDTSGKAVSDIADAIAEWAKETPGQGGSTLQAIDANIEVKRIKTNKEGDKLNPSEVTTG